ncbi:MAG: MFS transporter, partial [Actinomycetota bacterium]
TCLMWYRDCNFFAHDKDAASKYGKRCKQEAEENTLLKAAWSDVFWSNPVVVIVCVIIAGAFIGTNNTLVTTAVMSIAPVERPVASATYGFVRFIGGGLAPFVAGLLVTAFNPSIPFALGAATLVIAGIVLSFVHKALTAADRGEIAQPEMNLLDRVEDDDPIAGAVGVGNAD